MVNNKKNDQLIQEAFLEIKYFERILPKPSWEKPSFFSSNPASHYKNSHGEQKGSETSYQSPCKLLNIFKNLTSLVIHHPNIFDALI